LQVNILSDIRRIAHPLFWFFATCPTVLYFILEPCQLHPKNGSGWMIIRCKK
jgi:hypothetical protein